VEAVLDVDSAHLNDFDHDDAEQLAALCRRLETLL
jgi:putative methionine-R-sulfoxide reductase with GAF domain